LSRRNINRIVRVSVLPIAKTAFCAPTISGHARIVSLCSVFLQPVNIHPTDGPTPQVNVGRVALSLSLLTDSHQEVKQLPVPDDRANLQVGRRRSRMLRHNDVSRRLNTLKLESIRSDGVRRVCLGAYVPLLL
jgi:hypothetical protein